MGKKIKVFQKLEYKYEENLVSITGVLLHIVMPVHSLDCYWLTTIPEGRPENTKGA